MPFNIPYDKLPDGSPLELTDIIPILRSPNEEYRVSIQDVADTVLGEIPAATGEYDKAYSGTVTTNGTSPTGTPAHRYSFEVSKDGRFCYVHFFINWPNAGATITTFTIPFPDDLPDPLLVTGVSGANANLYPCFSIHQTALTTETTARGIIKINGSNDGYEIESVSSSGSFRICNVVATYPIAAP